jgi:putative transposase
LGFKVLELAINPDHVHLLISAYPTIPVHKIVDRIKGGSLNILRREFPELLRLRLYGRAATPCFNDRHSL